MLDMSKRSNLPVMERALRLRERMAINDVHRKTTSEASTSIDNQLIRSQVDTSFVAEDQLDLTLQVEDLNQSHLDSWRDWTLWEQWTRWSQY